MREDRAFEEKDFYQMYQDEMDCIIPCTEMRWRSFPRSSCQETRGQKSA